MVLPQIVGVPLLFYFFVVSWWPFSLLVGEGFLKAVEDRLVGCFDLPFALRISWHGHVLLDVLLLEELRQIFVRKLRAIVGDDELRDDN